MGVDDQDAEDDFNHFIDVVSNEGCEHFIVHARKAWLKGLSPKDNREVPPLDYDRVYRLKQRRPDLQISINGGIEDLDQCLAHQKRLDGVMLGRAAYHNPYMLASVDRAIFADDEPLASRAQIVARMMPYIEQELQNGASLNQITRHMMGLYAGEPGARHWRRYLSVEACKQGAGIEVVLEALALVERLREEAACRV